MTLAQLVSERRDKIEAFETDTRDNAVRTEPFVAGARTTRAWFILSQPCFPGWLGPGASLLCIPRTAGAGAATYAGTITFTKRFFFPRVPRVGSNRHENASFHTRSGSRTWLCHARICRGRDDSEECRGLREGWRHMGRCHQQVL